MTEYITIIEVLTMHKILIEGYGGSHGIRDMGALESALFRPQTGYYEDLIQEAAALWESISQNHPFIDGNKRSGAFAFIWFLKKNKVKGFKDINPSSLTALTLLIAESNPKNKNQMIALITQLLG
mgnify:CR=1 FL=1